MSKVSFCGSKALFAEVLTAVENSICLRTFSAEGVAALVAARVLPNGSACLGVTKFLFEGDSLPPVIIHFWFPVCMSKLGASLLTLSVL